VKDTLSIVSNSNGQTSPSPIWEQQADNNWYQYGTGGSWNLAASLLIHPFITSANSQAIITPSALTICSGNAIEFDAAGSTYEDTLLWHFPGGLPSFVPSDPTVSVTYPTPGTYEAVLYTVGGGCMLYDSAYVTITVNATPVVNISGTSEICNGESTVLTASGATSYTWSPPTGLSATTGNTVTANPTSTTTYSVTGTFGSCSNTSVISVVVGQSPVPLIGVTDTAYGCPTAVSFDGSNSTGASSFVWTFPGGTPATSNASSATVSFSQDQTGVAVQLVTANDCGTDSTILVMNIETAGPVPVIELVDSTYGCPTVVSFDGINSSWAGSYHWTFPGGTPATSDDPAVTVSFGNDTTGIAIGLTTTNDCGTDSTVLVIDIETSCGTNGIDEDELVFTVSYNASSGTVFVTSSNGIAQQTTARVLNELGQVLTQETAAGQQQTLAIPLQQLAAGMYFVHLESNGSGQLVKFTVH
jgi:hypothetical protein